MGSKRRCSREFKLRALELVKTRGKRVNQNERDLGITPGLLHKWKARMKAAGEQAFPGKGHLKEDEELIRQLKRENEVLRQERDILKNTGDFLSGLGVSYRFMRDHEGEFSLSLMCRVFGLARSGYYAWKEQGGQSKRERADNQLTEQIRTAFMTSQATYGSPRIYAELQAQGVVCSRHRVDRFMQQAGFSAVLLRRRTRTTLPGAAPTSPTNRLARDFTADAPNRKWLVDITAIATDEGDLYLAGVLDLFSRRLVG